jgi:creatinine amidohydrolase/Fe(II)-dependent formamide hydrolase-like protein
VLGDPADASAAEGKRLLDSLTDHLNETMDRLLAEPADRTGPAGRSCS